MREPSQSPRSPVFGIITALPKEFAAVKAMLDSCTADAAGTKVPYQYVIGEIPANNGEFHCIVLALLPAMGNNSAAIRAALLLEHYPSVRHILMVGIAGAAPNPGNPQEHVRLGDIVVSGDRGIVQYDYVSEKIDEVIHRNPPRPPSAELLEAVRWLEAGELAGDRPWLDHFTRAAHIRDTKRPEESTDRLLATPPSEGYLEHPSDTARTPGEPRIFVGPIGSANVLLRNPVKRDRIREQFGVRAFEMEGSGISDASWHQNVGYLAVRGTCDYCDGKKSDAWQGYAALAAAAFTRALIQSIPSWSPKQSESVAGQHNGIAATRGLSFTEQVAQRYRLLHYNVQRDQMFEGRAVNLFLSGQFGDVALHRVIECVGGAPSTEDLDRMLAKLRLVKKRFPGALGTVVSSASAPPAVQAQASAEGVTLVTLDELDVQILDGSTYARILIDEVGDHEKYRTDLYIEPKIGFEVSGDDAPATDVLDRWLADASLNQLTLLGDVGTGKTFLSRILAQRLADAYLRAPLSNPLPVLVDLRNADREFSLEGLLITHFQRKGLSRVTFDTFQHALSAGRVILLLDGFDEMAARVSPQITQRNFHELVKCVRGRAKVLLTCRTHYFKCRSDEEGVILARTGDYESEAARELYWDLITRSGFKIAYLRTFNAEQIEEYIARARPDDASLAISRVRGMYDLMELSKRPMLLDMIVKSIDRIGGGSMTAATLYKVFTDVWIQRDRWRRVLLPEVKLKLATTLALRLWTSGAPRIHHRDLLSHFQSGEDAPADVEALLELDNEMRTASFLVRDPDGYYAFGHKSYAEFFIARHIARELDESRVECLNTVQRISREILVFLIDLLRNAIDTDRLLTEVLTSNYRPRVSENALVLLYNLRKARSSTVGALVELPDNIRLDGAQLDGLTLSYVRVRGASLRSAVLIGASLTDAELSGSDFESARLANSSFQRSRLERCNFTSANLENVDMNSAVLRSANFTGAILRGAVLVGANMEGARFSGSLLNGAETDAVALLPMDGGSGSESPATSLQELIFQWLPQIKSISRVYATRADIDPTDFEQMVIVRIYEAWSRKELDARQVKDGALRSWILRVANSVFHDELRRIKRGRNVEMFEETEFAEPTENLAESKILREEELKLLRVWLGRLEPRAAKVLKAWLSGEGTADTANRMGLSVASVMRMRQSILLQLQRMREEA